ncbi:MAG TPA: aldehyde dehydrogenase family protein [Opitutaceae bacterium]|nr:aldehyde dehydrogenase family protein [Opitutaceae bacterium]
MPTLDVINPATGKRLAALPADDAASVRKKFLAARAAQPAWAATPLRRRLAALRAFRGAIVAKTDALALTLTSETGKPIAQARNELVGLLGRLDFFLAETPRALRTETVFTDRRARLAEKISWAPLGVVANISAWNYPYFVGSNVFVPALLAGNAVLYKPSEFAAQTGLAIARLLHASGVPAEVFAPLIGAGEVGAALLRQPVDGVFFTGSYATGWKIARAVAGRMIKLQLELGGKDPVYVCDDVDVAAAAASTADGAFYNNGQSCCAIERLYVHEKIFARFVDAFVATVKRFRIGDPRRASTYIGPLTRSAQLAVLEAQVADARKKGARILLGGARVRGRRNTFAPTVLVDVDHTMAVMREESFGPVIGLMPVRDDERAVDLMNDSAYGLTAGVYSRDAARARRILARVRAGSVYWNCCDRVSPRLPWSGVGHSGVGLTLSRHGIQTFARPKAWHLRAP